MGGSGSGGHLANLARSGSGGESGGCEQLGFEETLGLGRVGGEIERSCLDGSAVSCPSGELGMVGEWGAAGWRGGVSGASKGGALARRGAVTGQDSGINLRHSISS
jgi:hypothetical protein